MILDAEADIDVAEAANGRRRSRRPGACPPRRRAHGHPHAAPGRARCDPSAARGARDNRARLILTTFDLDEYVYEALRAGASGFLLKDVPDQLRRHAIVARGDALLAPPSPAGVVEWFTRREAHARPAPAGRSST